jgi:hypothetical protein
MKASLHPEELRRIVQRVNYHFPSSPSGAWAMWTRPEPKSEPTAGSVG